MADANGSTTPKEIGKGGDMSSSLKIKSDLILSGIVELSIVVPKT
jgi:hypothetical protein